MRKFLAMLVLLGFFSGLGMQLYAVTALDDEDYAQKCGGDADEPESWDDDNDLSQ
jgi:hypothetical protein